MVAMEVDYGFSSSAISVSKVLTIGAFDGVHLGHQALIRSVVNSAASHNLESTVMTFHPLPRQVLHGAERHLLSTLEERLELIAALGVDRVIVLSFDEPLINATAHDFVATLVDKVNPSLIWAGPDFRFGKNREGNLSFLVAASQQYGFTVNIFEEVFSWENQPVHSSRIRRALSVGNLEEVNGCLGRNFTMTGLVGHGDKRGRLLGFPTANLIPPEERLLPGNGVYIARALIGHQHYMALVNVGTRPTFDHDSPTVEAYLLDFSSDIYGATLRLEFLHLLRPEIKFPDAHALVQQMQNDEREARLWFESAARTPVTQNESSSICKA